MLWIRIPIRKNPYVLAGTVSESEKKFGFGYGSRHCCKINIFVTKKSQIKHLKEKKVYISVGKHFPLLYRFQNTYESNERHHLNKFRGKYY
jgi:hypothetical protein